MKAFSSPKEISSEMVEVQFFGQDGDGRAFMMV